MIIKRHRDRIQFILDGKYRRNGDAATVGIRPLSTLPRLRMAASFEQCSKRRWQIASVVFAIPADQLLLRETTLIK